MSVVAQKNVIILIVQMGLTCMFGSLVNAQIIPAGGGVNVQQRENTVKEQKNVDLPPPEEALSFIENHLREDADIAFDGWRVGGPPKVRYYHKIDELRVEECTVYWNTKEYSEIDPWTVYKTEFTVPLGVIDAEKIRVVKPGMSYMHGGRTDPQTWEVDLLAKDGKKGIKFRRSYADTRDEKVTTIQDEDFNYGYLWLTDKGKAEVIAQVFKMAVKHCRTVAPTENR